MRIVQLHKIGPQQRTDFAYDQTDEPGEPQIQQAPPTSPVAINVESIRCFYTRRADRGPGTRITFKDGGGFAVSESYEEVLSQVQGH